MCKVFTGDYSLRIVPFATCSYINPYLTAKNKQEYDNESAYCTYCNAEIHICCIFLEICDTAP